MKRSTLTRSVLASSLALALVACGGGGGDSTPTTTAKNPATNTPNNPNTPNTPATSTTTPAKQGTAGDVFAVTASNVLVSFNRATPGTLETAAPITGLAAGEKVVALNFRPADTKLYVLTNTGALYTVDTATGAATAKATITGATLDGTSFTMDFNPQIDRARIVSNTGQNLQVNADSGAATVGTAVSGAAGASVAGLSYTNDFVGTGSTLTFVIDAANKAVAQFSAGTGVVGTESPLGVDATSVNGFDIDARNGNALAAMTVGGALNLYNVAPFAAAGTPAATLVGAIALTEPLVGIAIAAPVATVYGLVGGNQLVSFNPLTPNTVSTAVPISGLGGETIRGFDVRRADNTLYAIGSNNTLFTIDPATAVATSKGPLNVSFTGNHLSVDFSPALDRLRVVGNDRQNVLIDVTKLTVATAPTVTPSTVTVSAAAYGASLYDIDTTTGNVYSQAADGTLTLLGPLGADATGGAAFDVAGGGNGLQIAALTNAAGVSSLYRISSAGAATPITTDPALSTIGTGATKLDDIAIVLK